MKTNKYLYDEEDLSWLLDLPYKVAFKIKILYAEKLLMKLVYKDNLKDNKRIAEVKKAIEFNKKMTVLKD